MTWRWDKPADHDEIAAKQAAQTYGQQIDLLLERAARDAAVDFSALVADINEKADVEKAEQSQRAASPKSPR